MYSTIFNLLSSSNYSITNQKNIFNFIISNLDIIPEENKERYITNIKINLGLTIYNAFKQYYITKCPSNSNVKYFS